MKAAGALELTLQFMTTSWTETPFHELPGAGKLSRASVTNALSGGLQGEGVLEYLLAYPAAEGGEVAFVGYERVSGQSEGRCGSFVLRHEGVFSRTDGVHGTLQIVPGSGAGDFAGMNGAGTISARAGEHGGVYVIGASLPAA